VPPEVPQPHADPFVCRVAPACFPQHDH
jgi:hypothetical protein